MSEEHLTGPINRANAQGTERRTSVRRPCNHETFCQPGLGRPDQLWWCAQMQDISAGGTGLVLRDWFEPGTILTVALRDVYTLPARVIRATVQTGGDWLLGCAFAHKLSDRELQALLS